MTDRLYYHDSFLYDFDAEVRAVIDGPRPGLILDRSAFYPTSGGQVFDTGWITPGTIPNDAAKFRVTEVADTDDGKIVHYFEAEVREVQESPKPALFLDRTAFYPTSGGQVFDTGWITSNSDAKFRVTEVADMEDEIGRAHV